MIFRRVLIAACVAVLAIAPTLARADALRAEGAASLSVTGSTGNVALPGSGNTLQICNVGTTEAFWALGGSTVTAATTSFSAPGSTCLSYTIDNAPGLYLAAITASSTTTLRLTVGRAQH